MPVCSCILFAALPVGAHRTTFIFLASYNFIMDLIIVVLPVPGPPVITHTLFSFIAFIAPFCSSDKTIFSFSSVFSNSALKFFIYLIFFALSNAINFSAMFCSAV